MPVSPATATATHHRNNQENVFKAGKNVSDVKRLGKMPLKVGFVWQCGQSEAGSWYPTVACIQVTRLILMKRFKSSKRPLEVTIQHFLNQ